MSDRKSISVSTESHEAISDYASSKGISEDEAADKLLSTAVTRRAALKRWFDKQPKAAKVKKEKAPKAEKVKKEKAPKAEKVKKEKAPKAEKVKKESKVLKAKTEKKAKNPDKAVKGKASKAVKTPAPLGGARPRKSSKTDALRAEREAAARALDEASGFTPKAAEPTLDDVFTGEDDAPEAAAAE